MSSSYDCTHPSLSPLVSTGRKSSTPKFTSIPPANTTLSSSTPVAADTPPISDCSPSNRSQVSLTHTHKFRTNPEHNCIAAMMFLFFLQKTRMHCNFAKGKKLQKQRKRFCFEQKQEGYTYTLTITIT